jgi:hypothetical protein
MFQKLPKINEPGQCSLTLAVQLGVMVDQQTWIAQQDFSPGHFDFDQIDITVWLDDTAYTVIPNTELAINFADSVNLAHHVFAIDVQGFDQSTHRSIHSIGDCAVMVQLQQFKIENLCMMQLMQDQAQGIDTDQQSFVPSEYQGINGTWTLEFACPIYHWLLDNHKNLLYYHSLNGVTKL